MLKQNAFKNLQLSVNKKNREQITDIITQLYKNKLQSIKKTGNIYKKTDPGILWFLNISKCKRGLILACFICKKTFKLFPDLINCYDNYIYNHINIGKIPDFELHNVIVRLAMIYKMTLEYSKCQLFTECNYICITNPRNLKTMTKKTLIYEKALNGFARQRWPDHGLTNIKFLSD